MKVGIIDPSLFTWPYDRRLADGLRSVGHEVTLIGKAVRPGEEGADDPLLHQHFYTRTAGLSGGRLPPGLARLVKGLDHAASLAALGRWLDRWRPDVLHFQWLPLPVIDRLFLPRLRRIAPLVLTVHDSNPFNGEAALWMQRIGLGSALALFDHVIVHNHRAVERVREFGVAPERISVIAHGLLNDDLVVGPDPKMPDTVSPAPGEAAPDGRWPARPKASPPPIGGAPHAAEGRGEPLTFLQFGKIRAYKGVDVLIKAAALMPAEVRRRCRIKVVGKPYSDPRPLLEMARALGVDDTIEFDLRFVSDEEMRRHFAGADGIVLPYREIDASGVLMVALAAGLPIVASAIGGFAETLEDGRHGLLVPPGDERALAAALCRLVTDGGLRASMRAEVAALRAGIPSWRDIAIATAAVYNRAGISAAPATAQPSHQV